MNTESARTFTLRLGRGKTCTGVQFPAGKLMLHDPETDTYEMYADEPALLEGWAQQGTVHWDDEIRHQLVLDGTLLDDILAALRNDEPFPVHLAPGFSLNIVAGSHESETIGIEHADLGGYLY